MFSPKFASDIQSVPFGAAVYITGAINKLLSDYEELERQHGKTLKENKDLRQKFEDAQNIMETLRDALRDLESGATSVTIPTGTTSSGASSSTTASTINNISRAQQALSALSMLLAGVARYGLRAYTTPTPAPLGPMHGPHLPSGGLSALPTASVENATTLPIVTPIASPNGNITSVEQDPVLPLPVKNAPVGDGSKQEFSLTKTGDVPTLSGVTPIASPAKTSVTLPTSLAVTPAVTPAKDALPAGLPALTAPVKDPPKLIDDPTGVIDPRAPLSGIFDDSAVLPISDDAGSDDSLDVVDLTNVPSSWPVADVALHVGKDIPKSMDNPLTAPGDTGSDVASPRIEYSRENVPINYNSISFGDISDAEIIQWNKIKSILGKPYEKVGKINSSKYKTAYNGALVKAQMQGKQLEITPGSNTAKGKALYEGDYLMNGQYDKFLESRYGSIEPVGDNRVHKELFDQLNDRAVTQLQYNYYQAINSRDMENAQRYGQALGMEAGKINDEYKHRHGSLPISLSNTPAVKIDSFGSALAAILALQGSSNFTSPAAIAAPDAPGLLPMSGGSYDNNRRKKKRGKPQFMLVRDGEF